MTNDKTTNIKYYHIFSTVNIFIVAINTLCWSLVKKCICYFCKAVQYVAFTDMLIYKSYIMLFPSMTDT